MNHLFIDSCIKIIFHIQYISNSTAHTGCEVLTCSAKDCYASACHIFTSVISYTFYNCCRTGITYCKTFSRHAIDEYFTAGCPVKCHVTDDNVFFRFIAYSFWWIYYKFSAGKSLSEIVITVTGQFQCQSFRNKCAEGLSAGTLTMYHIAVFVQTFRISSRNLRTKDCTKCTVRICHIYFNASLLFLLYRREQFSDQNFFIQSFLQFKVEDFLRIECHRCLCAFIWIIENLFQIQCGCTF